MSETAEKKTRRVWTHHDIGALIAAHQDGGAAAARKAFEGDFSVDAVDSKLQALGLVRLEHLDRKLVSDFVETLKLHDHPTLIVDYAIAELRKARKGDAS